MRQGGSVGVIKGGRERGRAGVKKRYAGVLVGEGDDDRYVSVSVCVSMRV